MLIILLLLADCFKISVILSSVKVWPELATPKPCRDYWNLSGITANPNQVGIYMTVPNTVFLTQFLILKSNYIKIFICIPFTFIRTYFKHIYTA